MGVACRDPGIDVCRVVTTYLIVVLHAWGAASQYGVSGSLESAVWKFIGINCVMGMYVLFVVSGYLMFEGLECLKDWQRKMSRRLRRLVVPYLCWNLVFVLLYLAVGNLFPRIGERIAKFGLDTWFGAFSKIGGLLTMPIDFPLWYMRTIFMFALAAPIMGFALRRQIGRWIGLGAVMGYYLLVEEFRVLPDVEAYPAFALLLWYCGGLMTRVRSNGLGLCEWFRNPWWIAVGMAGFALDGLEAMDICDLLSFRSRMILKSCVFLCLVRAFRRTNVAPFLDFSFFVYCGHFLFCSVWVHTLGPKLAGIGLGCESALMLAFIIPGLALTAGVYALSKKLCPKVLKLFNGTL